MAAFTFCDDTIPLRNFESSTDIGAIRTVFNFIFILWRNSKHLKHKQSSIDIEAIRTVFNFIFLLWRNSKHLKHKQKHLSNIQPCISKQETQTKASKEHLTKHKKN